QRSGGKCVWIAQGRRIADPSAVLPREERPVTPAEFREPSPDPRVPVERRVLAPRALDEEVPWSACADGERLQQLALASREPVARVRQLLQQTLQGRGEEGQRCRVLREERLQSRRLRCTDSCPAAGA